MTEVPHCPQQFPSGPDGGHGPGEPSPGGWWTAGDPPWPVSRPVRDPSAAYVSEPGLRTGDFALSPDGLGAARRRGAICALELYLAERRDHFLGYQATQDMRDTVLDLARFMPNNINNLGDPFRSGGYKLNTKVVERAVLDYYAALWNAAWPHDPENGESYWGYVLSMGSTEGNMYGLWNARDYLGGKPLLRPERVGAAGPAPVRAPACAERPVAFRPVAFYSEDTHYSVAKAVRVLGIETFHDVAESLYGPGDCPLTDAGGAALPWPREVPCEPGPSGGPGDGSGRIDVDALVKLVDFFAGRGHPVLISLNLGSTFKGAHDEVDTVCARLLPVFERYGMVDGVLDLGTDPETGERITERRRRFWIHVDGALGAAYVPFVRMARERKDGAGRAPDAGSSAPTGAGPSADGPGPGTPPGDGPCGTDPADLDLPAFDFGLTPTSPVTGRGVDMVASIAMSGHKWPGAPWPCGIYMTKVKYQLRPPARAPYIDTRDTTFAGSRNGLSPLMLWDHLARHSYEDQIALIRRAQRLSGYLLERLDGLRATHGIDLWAARSPGAITVRFRRPGDATVAKWSLSCQDVLTDPEDPAGPRAYAHVFLMSSVTRERVDALVDDLVRDFTAVPRPASVPAARTALPGARRAVSARP
ncbi:histidine decarboxylase [Streptomyces sp. NPDC057682]|uniref:histidine decarboxylase n=1 Tax=unclassified Streptomyces TaxID=2593676 RepID=UPI003656BD39